VSVEAEREVHEDATLGLAVGTCKAGMKSASRGDRWNLVAFWRDGSWMVVVDQGKVEK
jgi:hypothetical protein